MEFSGIEKHMHMLESMKCLPYPVVGFCNHLYVDTGDDGMGVTCLKRMDNYEYSKEGILECVNARFSTSFDDLYIDEGLWVHDSKVEFSFE